MSANCVRVAPSGTVASPAARRVRSSALLRRRTTFLNLARGANLEPLPLTFCEGVRVTYEDGKVVALERLRAD